MGRGRTSTEQRGNSSSLSKSAGFVSLSGKALLVPVSDAILLILACLFTVGLRISWKKLCWKESMAAEMPK